MGKTVPHLLILLAMISGLSCSDKKLIDQEKSQSNPTKGPYLENYGERGYQLVMDLDTALAHPLEVKSLILNNWVEYDSLPSSITTLSNLQYLKISNQTGLEFESLLENLQKLDSLKELEIETSNFHLGNQIHGLKQIKTLSLLNNSLSEFQLNTLDSLALKTLIISEQNGFSLAGKLGTEIQLKQLLLYGYSDKALNPNIYKLSQLEELTIHGDSLAFIPSEITRLEHLEILDVAETPLALDTKQIEKLRKLMPRTKIVTRIQPPH